MNKAAFLLAEGLKNLWRNKVTATSTVAVLTTVLTASGIFMMAHANSSVLIQYLRSKYKIEVFLETSVTDNVARDIAAEIRKLDKVRSVTLNTRDDAVRIFQRQFGEDVEEMLGYNPLPASCVVNIERENFGEGDVDILIGKINEIPGIDEVYYQGRLIKRIERYYQLGLKVFAGFIGVFLLVATILIYFTIQLSVYSRKELIRTLQLNGASRFFVKIPFILEGLFQGWLAAGISVGLIYVIIRVSREILETFRVTLIMDHNISLILFAVASTVAIIASHHAIARHLK